MSVESGQKRRRKRPGRKLVWVRGARQDVRRGGAAERVGKLGKRGGAAAKARITRKTSGGWLQGEKSPDRIARESAARD